MLSILFLRFLGSNFVLLVGLSSHSQLILLKFFIYLNFCFIFSPVRRMHSALLTASFGLKLFSSCRYNCDLVLVLLTASIGLIVLLFIARGCHLLSLPSTSFSAVNLIFFFTCSNLVLFVFPISFASLNLVLLLAQGYKILRFESVFHYSKHRPPACN